MRMSRAVMLGIQFARGGQLPLEYFDATAWSEEEAEMVQEDVNVERLIAQASAEARRS
jgi:hypothetical protein